MRPLAMASPPNQPLQTDRGRITVFRDITLQQRPRLLSFVDYEAVGKSTHNQNIFAISDASQGISRTKLVDHNSRRPVFLERKKGSGVVSDGK
jgi:hypothetical protein